MPVPAQKTRRNNGVMISILKKKAKTEIVRVPKIVALIISLVSDLKDEERLD
jgi:hypothetical protein